MSRSRASRASRASQAASASQASNVASRRSRKPSRVSSIMSTVSRAFKEVQVERPKKRRDIPKDINRIKGLIGLIIYFFFLINLYSLLRISQETLSSYLNDCYDESEGYQKSVEGNSFRCTGQTIMDTNTTLTLLMTVFAVAHALHVTGLACGAFGFWFLSTTNVITYLVLFLLSSLMMVAIVLVESLQVETLFTQMHVDVADLVVVVTLFVIEIIVYLIGLATFIRWLSHLRAMSRK